MTTKATQGDRILADLKAGRSIDPLTALRKYGTMRLGARILELRESGYKIDTELVRVRTRTGYARIAAYRMAA